MYNEDFLNDVWDLTCDTFVMGELDYWTSYIEVHRDGGHIALREDDEGDMNLTRHVWRDDLVRGLDLLRAASEEAEMEFGVDYGQWRSYSLAGLRENNAGELDSISVDVMVQLMLFGEVVYG